MNTPTVGLLIGNRGHATTVHGANRAHFWRSYLGSCFFLGSTAAGAPSCLGRRRREAEAGNCSGDRFRVHAASRCNGGTYNLRLVLRSTCKTIEEPDGDISAKGYNLEVRYTKTVTYTSCHAGCESLRTIVHLIQSLKLSCIKLR